MIRFSFARLYIPSLYFLSRVKSKPHTKSSKWLQVYSSRLKSKSWNKLANLTEEEKNCLKKTYLGNETDILDNSYGGKHLKRTKSYYVQRRSKSSKLLKFDVDPEDISMKKAIENISFATPEKAKEFLVELRQDEVNESFIPLLQLAKEVHADLAVQVDSELDVTCLPKSLQPKVDPLTRLTPINWAEHTSLIEKIKFERQFFIDYYKAQGLIKTSDDFTMSVSSSDGLFPIDSDLTKSLNRDITRQPSGLDWINYMERMPSSLFYIPFNILRLTPYVLMAQLQSYWKRLTGEDSPQNDVARRNFVLKPLWWSEGAILFDALAGQIGMNPNPISGENKESIFKNNGYPFGVRMWWWFQRQIAIGSWIATDIRGLVLHSLIRLPSISKSSNSQAFSVPTAKPFFILEFCPGQDDPRCDHSGWSYEMASQVRLVQDRSPKALHSNESSPIIFINIHEVPCSDEIKVIHYPPNGSHVGRIQDTSTAISSNTSQSVLASSFSDLDSEFSHHMPSPLSIRFIETFSDDVYRRILKSPYLVDEYNKGERPLLRERTSKVTNKDRAKHLESYWRDNIFCHSAPNIMHWMWDSNSKSSARPMEGILGCCNAVICHPKSTQDGLRSEHIWGKTSYEDINGQKLFHYTDTSTQHIPSTQCFSDLCRQIPKYFFHQCCALVDAFGYSGVPYYHNLYPTIDGSITEQTPQDSDSPFSETLVHRRIIYTTDSMNPLENEAVISRVLMNWRKMSTKVQKAGTLRCISIKDAIDEKWLLSLLPDDHEANGSSLNSACHNKAISDLIQLLQSNIGMGWGNGVSTWRSLDYDGREMDYNDIDEDIRKEVATTIWHSIPQDSMNGDGFSLCIIEWSGYLSCSILERFNNLIHPFSSGYSNESLENYSLICPSSIEKAVYRGCSDSSPSFKWVFCATSLLVNVSERLQKTQLDVNSLGCSLIRQFSESVTSSEGSWKLIIPGVLHSAWYQEREQLLVHGHLSGSVLMSEWKYQCENYKALSPINKNSSGSDISVLKSLPSTIFISVRLLLVLLYLGLMPLAHLQRAMMNSETFKIHADNPSPNPTAPTPSFTDEIRLFLEMLICDMNKKNFLGGEVHYSFLLAIDPNSLSMRSYHLDSSWRDELCKCIVVAEIEDESNKYTISKDSQLRKVDMNHEKLSCLILRIPGVMIQSDENHLDLVYQEVSPSSWFASSSVVALRDSLTYMLEKMGKEWSKEAILRDLSFSVDSSK